MARVYVLDVVFFAHDYLQPSHLHSFPTRRSSDLPRPMASTRARAPSSCSGSPTPTPAATSGPSPRKAPPADRKSTRLNSSHLVISYAVFCLKKKNSTSGKLLCTCTEIGLASKSDQ